MFKELLYYTNNKLGSKSVEYFLILQASAILLIIWLLIIMWMLLPVVASIMSYDSSGIPNNMCVQFVVKNCGFRYVTFI